ncbi:MAG: hypothetical protein KA170_02275 [Candidatus Promineofilum sp.]|nr:hypothetical protein [Promineifilum sp.]
MIDRDSFTVEEWGSIISVPASVGALVVSADMSGPIGLIGEFRAIMNSMKEYVDAHAADSPLMRGLQSYMMTKPTKEEEAELKKWAEEQQETLQANKPETPEDLKQLVRDRSAAVISMLREKGATEGDIGSLKAMIYAVAEAVADASKEGGFLGFGGTRVSSAEESVLNQIKAELGI